VAINKDSHARIIIMRPEMTLHSEAGYIFAGCSLRNRFFLQFGGGPFMLRQLSEAGRTCWKSPDLFNVDWVEPWDAPPF
jgi:hypothetical protein